MMKESDRGATETHPKEKLIVRIFTDIFLTHHPDFIDATNRSNR